jgi:dimethylglycine dehydrogenase
MDISAFTKVEVAGADAEAFLDGLTPNRLAQKDWRHLLTHLLNRRGRIELEDHVIKLARPVLSGLRGLLRATPARPPQLPTGPEAPRSWSSTARTSGRPSPATAACPRHPLAQHRCCARQRLIPLADAQEITVAGHKVWALRMSYAGELGWEFHGPREAFPDIYDALWKTGAPMGLIDYGSFAMNVMRLEKAFKGAAELTNEVTLPEADVMRFVKLDPAKKGDFLGREQTIVSLDSKARPGPASILKSNPTARWTGMEERRCC